MFTVVKLCCFANFRYLLRVAGHVADPGWPVPPTVLLVLCDKLGFFADTSLYALLRLKEVSTPCHS